MALDFSAAQVASLAYSDQMCCSVLSVCATQVARRTWYEERLKTLVLKVQEQCPQARMDAYTINKG
eukprot:843983-Amphidinium_carterae.1